MTRYPQLANNSGLFAINSANHQLIQSTLDPTNGYGLVVPGASTYMFPLGGERYGSVVETVVHSLSAKWPTGIVGTITIEGTNFPRTTTGLDQGPGDVTDDDTTGAWQLIDITNTGMVYATASGTGSMAKYTCTITSGVGAAAWNIPDLGFLRMRAKLVATVGGFLRLNMNAKLGS